MGEMADWLMDQENDGSEPVEQPCRACGGRIGAICSRCDNTGYDPGFAREAAEKGCTCGQAWPCPLHGGPPEPPALPLGHEFVPDRKPARCDAFVEITWKPDSSKRMVRCAKPESAHKPDREKEKEWAAEERRALRGKLDSLEREMSNCPYCGKQVWSYGRRRPHGKDCPLDIILAALDARERKEGA